ncbi:MAG: monooxygenase, partial [Actinomycetes bacterium]
MVGTWYWNQYPGAQCDIESYIYLPLLEELGYVPKEKYSYGPEIYAHARRIAEHYRLLDDALFSTHLTSAVWDDDSSHWVIDTDRGDHMTADWVVMATGPLSKPKLPGIPGIETYEGHAFHTSRWDYAYTGGDTTGGL